MIKNNNCRKFSSVCNLTIDEVAIIYFWEKMDESSDDDEWDNGESRALLKDFVSEDF